MLDSYKGAYLNKQNGVSAIDISTLNVINGEPLIIEITLISLYDVDLYASATNAEVAGITVSAPATRLPANAGQSILTGEKSGVCDYNNKHIEHSC